MDEETVKIEFGTSLFTTLRFDKLKEFRRTINNLLKTGAEATVVNIIGQPALTIAAQNPSCTRKIIRDFVKYGADVNVSDENDNTPLHRAANNHVSNVRVINELLNQEAEIDATNFDLETPLHIAVLNCNCASKNAIKTLLNRGAALQAEDHIGNTPLHRVVRNPYQEMHLIKPMAPRIDEYSEKHIFVCLLRKVKLLLSYKADVNAQNKFGDSPLLLAVQNPLCNLNLIKVLIQSGADTKLKNFGNVTTLHFAVKHMYDLNIIELLLQHELDIEARDHYFNTPMHYAVHNCNCKYSSIGVLLNKGANIRATNCDGDTPLHIAVQSYFADQSERDTFRPHRFNETSSNCMLNNVKILLAHGANINARNLKGDSPLQLAISNRACSSSVINELLRQGADIHSKNDEDHTPFYFAIQNIETRLDLVKELLNLGVEVNVQDESGVTFLHNVAANHSDTYEAVTELIKYGVDVNALNSFHDTPLHFTLQNNPDKLTVVQSLLKNGADVNAPNRAFNTPFHIAADNSRIKVDVLQELINAGANVKTRNNGRHNALMMGVRSHFRNTGYAMESLKFLFKYTWIANIGDDFRNEVREIYVRYEIEGAEEILRYADACAMEISQMKGHLIDNNFSLYELIIPKQGIFSKIEVEENYVNQILEIMRKNTYPIYSDYMGAKLGRVCLLHKLLQQRIYTVINLSCRCSKKIVLGHTPTRNIAKYLSNVDLLNLNMALYLSYRFSALEQVSLANLGRTNQNSVKRRNDTFTGNMSKRRRSRV